MNIALPTLSPFIPDEDHNTLAHRWKKWVEAFEDILIILNDKETDATIITTRQRALLKHYVGDATKDILATLPDAGSSYNEAITALNKYFGAQKNIDYEIYLFRQIKQLGDESIDQFLTRLRKASSTCDFQNEDREIKSQIVLGGKSSKLRRHILQTPAATLPELLKYARANETAERHATAIEELTANTTVMNINQDTKMRGKAQPPTSYRSEHSKQPRQNDQQQFRRSPQAQETRWRGRQAQQQKSDYHLSERKSTESRNRQDNNCKFCGEPWHKEGLSACRAQGKTCNSCKKVNHFASVCRSTQRHREQYRARNTESKNRELTNYTREDNDLAREDNITMDDYVLANCYRNTKDHRYETVNLAINNANLEFVIDTGATLNMINNNDFKKLNPRPKLMKPTSKTYAFGSKQPLTIEGTTEIAANYKNQKHMIKFHVTKEKGPSLVGKETALKLGVVAFIHHLETQTERPEITAILKEYNQLFQGIGKLKTATVKLHIDETVEPIIQRHRRIPFHIRKMVEEEITDLLKEDIIERVPESEPTTWLSPIVVRPKKDDPNRIRICVDMKAANNAIQREHYLTPTIDDVIYDLNNMKIFSKLDLNKGYHQLELHEGSRPITTFGTHIGMFRYKRLSFGINSAAETFQREIHKTIQGIPGVMNVSDDVLIYGRSEEEHDKTLRTTMERLKMAGLTLNRKKCKFSKRQLKFLGHIFSDKGMQPDPGKIRAIQDIQAPTNPTEIRSFIGLTNFCTKYVPGLAISTQPLRNLTKKSERWKWNSEEEEAFKNIKHKLAAATNLNYFDKTKNTELWVDAGPTGLGAVLSQTTTSGPQSIIAFASHTLNNTESRYSQIEKEALAITWAIKHFHLYLYGHPFIVITDHKPLLPLFNKANQSLSTRLERWKCKLQQYQFEVAYRPGRNNPADYMSRHPVKTGSSKSCDSIAENYVNFVLTNSIPKTITIEEIKEHTRNDQILQQVISNIKMSSWDEKDNRNTRNPELKDYNKIKKELATDNQESVLLRGTRLVIPSTLRSRILNIAHASHQGISRTKAILREKIWFPGINKQVEKLIAKCRQCQAVTNDHSHPELHPSEPPEGPWRELNIDHKGPLPSGEHLLVIMDQFTKFPIVEITPSTATKTNIAIIDKIFAIFGTPRIIHTDNGAPFNSAEFHTYLTTHGIMHKRITPRWPRANGAVERFNKTLGKILKIAHEFNQDWKKEMNNLLRDYRTTPHKTTKVTPAELLFNYSSSNRLPDARNLSYPTNDEAIKERIKEQNTIMKNQYNAKHNPKNNQPQQGDIVLMKQPQTHKMKTCYDPDPFKVTTTNNSMITAERKGRTVTRNASFFKIISDEIDKTNYKEQSREEEGEDTETIVQHQSDENLAKPTKREQNGSGAQNKIQEQSRISNPMEKEQEEPITPSESQEDVTRYNLRKITRPPTRLIEE